MYVYIIINKLCTYIEIVNLNIVINEYNKLLCCFYSTIMDNESENDVRSSCSGRQKLALQSSW